MRCVSCNHENDDTTVLCSNCGNPLRAGPPIIQQIIPRDLPPDSTLSSQDLFVCQKCGHVFPMTTPLCNSCGWDSRVSFKQKSPGGAKGCLSTVLKKVFGILMASAVSFGVGWISTALGLGEFLSKLITTAASTILSFIPVIFGRIKINTRANKSMIVALLIFTALFGAASHPAQAQSMTPVDILQSLLEQVDANAVEWGNDPNYPDSTVYFKSTQNAGEYTNAAQVVNLKDTMGSSGGQIWLDSYLEILEAPDKGCRVQPYTLHGSRAYSYECKSSSSFQAGILWERGEWAAAVYNFVYPVGDYSVEYLAENLYGLIPASEDGSTLSEDNLVSPQNVEWTQDDINRMAIQVLDRYAEAKGWPVNPPCTTFSACMAGEDAGVFVYEQRNQDLVEKALRGDPTLQSSVLAGEASYFQKSQLTDYQVSNGYAYNNVYILYLPDQAGLKEWLTNYYEDVDLNPGYSDYVSPTTIVLQNDLLDFHGQEALLQRLVVQITNPGESASYPNRHEVFAWIQYPWYFSIVGNIVGGAVADSQTIDIPLFDLEKDPELLYLLASQAGMFNPPNPSSATSGETDDQSNFSVTTPELVFTEEEIADMSENDLLALAALLGPAALLPALGVAGLSLLLDSLRRKPAAVTPAGMVQSPFSGFGIVSTEIAANHASLIQQGYTYNPATGRLSPPMFHSPFDGRLIPRHELERELGLKSQGFILRGDEFVLPESLNRDQRWEEAQQKSYQGSLPTREKIQQQEMAKALEEQQRQQRIEHLRSAVPQMEEQAQLDYRASEILQQDTIGTMWKASQMTARTVVTGMDPDGNMSFLAMGGRMLAGGLTAGASEVVMNAADFGYRTYDGVQSGMSIPGAAAVSLAWMGLESGVLKAGGKIFKWAASSDAAGWAAGQIRSGASSLTDNLNPYKESVLDPALEKVNTTLKSALGNNQVGEFSEDQIRALFQKNGRNALRDLESKGMISPAEARTITQVITKDVNHAVSEATPHAIRNFEKQFDVKIKSVTVADSGSSSVRSLAPRSVNSDFDRSILVEFDNASLDRLTRQLMEGNKSLTQAQAREMAQNELQSQFSNLHEKQMNNQLSKIGLNTKDLDYKNYSGLSGDPKMGDSYPAGFNRTRMANQGEAMVFRQNPSGEIVTSKMTGQQVVDQEALSKIQLSRAEGQQAADIINQQQPIISLSDAQNILSQQNQVALGSNDPLKLAKALLRADKAQRILAGKSGATGLQLPKIPESILHIAEDLIKNPQQSIDQIPTDFSSSAAEQIRNLFSVINP